MNVEIGTEAAQFPEKEYIKGIFLAVYLSLCIAVRNTFPIIMFLYSYVKKKNAFLPTPRWCVVANCRQC
jgi:hypothetical protein